MPPVQQELLLPSPDLPNLNPSEQPTDRQEEVIIARALEILAARHRTGELITDPESTKQYLRIKLAGELSEVFGCIFVDNRHRILAVEDLFFGTIDGANVYPRVIVQKALLHNAAAIFVYHNHPSQVAEPSQADRKMTDRIREALAYVDVRLLDHLVVSVEEVVSFAERGML